MATRQFVVIDLRESVRGPFDSIQDAAFWIRRHYSGETADHMEVDNIRELCPPDGDYPPPR